jgi:hypothetical protein
LHTVTNYLTRKRTPPRKQIVAAGRFAVETGAIIAGAMPPAVHRLVRDWAGRHRAELLDNWERGRPRQAMQRIPGADVE